MGRRPVLTLLATALACLLVAAPAAARVPAGFVGITADDVFAGDAHYRTSNLSAQAAIGVQTIRQTFDWSTIERRRGEYDLRYHDEYVAKAAAHGIRVLPVLFNPPRFHRPSRGRATCPPRRNADFARFAAELVHRYGPGGSLWRERPDVPRKPIAAWQIWNEPNLRIYWCGRPNARRYVAMLRSVGGAIERVDRRAHILTAGLPPSTLQSAVPLDRYLRGMYRAGARRAFDSLAINPYARDPGELRRVLRSVRHLMNRRGDRSAGIWITELGWGDRGPRHRFVVGARGQATRIRSSFELIRRQRGRLRLRGAVYYSWRDASPYPPLYRDLWGLHTGLLRMNGGFKPAYFAFKRAVSRLR
jgi:polysaccharide biosynthesis protein PslG